MSKREPKKLIQQSKKTEPVQQKKKEENPYEEVLKNFGYYPAEVVEILMRTGPRGELTTVQLKILAGPEQGRILTRNVMGPVRKGDILCLSETRSEAKNIKSK